MDDKPTYQELQERVLVLEQNLSDLRTAQEAMQEREDLYRGLLEKANDGIGIIQDWKVKYTNVRLAAMLGVEAEELVDADFLDFVLPEDRARVTDIHRRRLEDEKVAARTEFVVNHKSGKPLIVETSSSLVAYHEKPAIFATIRDITDQKEAERILKEREESFRTLFEISFDGLMLHEIGTILETNQTLSTMTGYDLEEIPGMNVTQLISPEMRDTMIENMKLDVETTYETVGMRKDHSTFPVEVRRKPIKYKGRDVILGTVRDISEQKSIENTMRKNEEKYTTIFENAQVGIFRTSLEDGIVLEANLRIVEMFGYESKEDVIGKVSVVDLYADSDTRSRMISELNEFGEIRNFEARFKSKTGAITWIRFSGEVNLTEGYLEGVASDITEMKNAEMERARIEKQYRQAQKVEAIGRLAGGVAHDMNNLLVPIVGYSELLLTYFDPGDRLHHFVKQISEAGDRCKDLVQQLLAFGRKQTLEYQPIDLNHTIVEFGQLLNRTIRENIEISTVLAPEIETIRADIGQIEQVIMNLCVNAQDAMQDGGKLVMETAVTEFDRSDVLANPGFKMGRYVVLAVSDTGVGMDPATKKQIFEPFFSTKGARGTGLGLATVYGIVMQHGGNISVYSEVGKGTTFKVYLPVSDASGAAVGTTETSVEDLQGTETVLLVEDNQQVRDLGYQALTVFGYRVLVAQDGEEALDKLSSYRETIHLLLTDVIMPGMNGRELYEKAIEILPELRVLYMSGYTDNVIAHHGVLKEGVQLIQKPFSVVGLATKVREVLES
jgi:two-component system, cell cycle sensor histidine kinase and response regulator CckA